MQFFSFFFNKFIMLLLLLLLDTWMVHASEVLQSRSRLCMFLQQFFFSSRLFHRETSSSHCCVEDYAWCLKSVWGRKKKTFMNRFITIDYHFNASWDCFQFNDLCEWLRGLNMFHITTTMIVVISCNVSLRATRDKLMAQKKGFKKYSSIKKSFGSGKLTQMHENWTHFKKFLCFA